MKRDMDKRPDTYKNKFPIPEEIRFVYDRAVDLKRENKTQSARTVLLGLMELFPEEPRILNLIGTTYLDEPGREEDAEKYFLLAIRYAPDFGDALSNLSGIYSRMERYEDSAKYAQQAIKVYPEYAPPWMTLGLYYARLGEVKTALEYFLAAYSRDGNYSLAAYNAACALSELGRYEESIEYLEKSMVLRRNLECAKTDPNLDALREYPEYRRIIAEAEKRLSKDL